jgi:hypothetical protein
MNRKSQVKDGYTYSLLNQEDPDEQDLESARDGYEFRMYTNEIPTDGTTSNKDAEGQIATNEEESCLTFDAVFGKTLQALESQNSLLRTGDNMQLMTRILLNSTYGYLEVARLYKAAIARLRWLLNDPGTPNKDDLVDKVDAAKHELNTLQRHVQPFVDYVVPTLVKIGKQGSETSVEYQINEVVNNIRAFEPLITSAVDTCKSIAAQYDRDSSDQMNKILNILTFITFVITPMQLMTGIYGMNFRVMPELDWHHGYPFFWMTSLTLSILFCCILYCFNRHN